MFKHGFSEQLSIYDIDPDLMDMKRDVYVLIENDKFELPICVCDSVEELSEITGDSVGYIHDMIRKAEKRNGNSKYIRVTINDDME